MMLRHCLLVFGLLLASAIARSQAPDPNQPVGSVPVTRQWVLKFAPLSLFDPDNTVQFGVERLLGRQHALQAEFGYGGQGMNLWQNSRNQRYSDREVWRGRAEYRYYFSPTRTPVGAYVAAEGFFKQVNARESGTTGVGCETGLCQYYQMFTAPVSKRVWGGHVKFGYQFSLVPDNRLLIDFYAGLGFRRSTVERAGRPSGTYYYRSAGYSLFDAFTSQPYAVASLAYGIKIGYAL